MNNKFRLAGESPFTNISIFVRLGYTNTYDDPNGSEVRIRCLFYYAALG